MAMITGWLNKFRNRLGSIQTAIGNLEYKMQLLQEAVGRVESRQLVPGKEGLAPYEFKVFSQNGEDGILQYLTQIIPLSSKTFIEFGVQDYSEANTRFLLTQGGWKGLILDASQESIQKIQQDRISAFYELYCEAAFITRENINSLFKQNGFVGDIGLLSIDIDGNDFWIWDEIDCVKPAIVVCEYNYRFGDKLAVTTPYQADFNRYQAHYSRVYYGASLKALVLLAKNKGYDFVGCNESGVNAFFIKKDLRPAVLKAQTVESGFRFGRVKDALDKNGNLVRMSFEEEHKMVSSLPLVTIGENGKPIAG